MCLNYNMLQNINFFLRILRNFLKDEEICVEAVNRGCKFRNSFQES